jgi:predicted ABC-type ATPase
MAGCTGAGKTTAAYTIFPEMLGCREFVNADEIAKGISPFQPDTVEFLSGRLMLARISELILEHKEFAFESSLSNLLFGPLIKKARAQGYSVHLIFLYVQTYEVCVARVRSRVLSGGKNISDEIVQRRYKRSIKNLFNLYLPIADHWMVIDHSDLNPELIATGGRDLDMEVSNEQLWEEIKKQARDF